MKSDIPNKPHEELELKITALLLGELDAPEAERIRGFIAQDPELSRLHDELKQALGLVKEASRDLAEETEPLRLPRDKRDALLAHFKTSPLHGRASARSRAMPWYVPAGIAAALIAVAVLIGLLPATKQFAAQRPSIVPEMPTLDLPESRLADESFQFQGTTNHLPAQTFGPTSEDGHRRPNARTAGQLGQIVSSAESSVKAPQRAGWSGQLDGAGGWLGDVSPNGSARKPDTQNPRGRYVTDFSQNGIALPKDTDHEDLKSFSESRLAYRLSAPELHVGDMVYPPPSGGRGGGTAAIDDTKTRDFFFDNRGRDRSETQADLPVAQWRLMDKQPEPQKTAPAEQVEVPQVSQRSIRGAAGVSQIATASAGGEKSKSTDLYDIALPKEETSALALANTPKPNVKVTGHTTTSAPPKGLVELQVSSGIARPESTAANEAVRRQADTIVVRQKEKDLQSLLAQRDDVERKLYREKQTQVDKLRSNKANEDLLPPRQSSPDAPTPQPELQTTNNPFSTFSLNVSDVSFKLAAASLEKGQMPDVATLRSEEFLNAFDYHDPAPAFGQPLAFAWERARDPFAHNRDLLRFSIQTAARGREAGRPLNLVLLLDNSGSMERADRVRIIRECLNVLAAQLTPQDKISVVTFARAARLWVDGVPGEQAAASLATVGQLTPEGGTNLEEAMNLAYATARRHYLANGVNRVVLLTDGAANLGNVDPESLKATVETQRRQGIALDCFGIGWEGYNDDLLEALSRNGDGRYGFVNTPQDAAREFAGQLAGALQVAASDVKVQVEFNPQRVTAYRQIGYAKHQLTKEQFRDNTVDAAEIGAAESGNALYVIETDPQGQGPLAIVRARFKVPATGEYKECEWAVPYTGEAVALESASAAMRLAATASAFSEWLTTSPYAGEVSPDRLLNILRGVPEVFGADSRPKKLEGMIREAARIAGN